ncbi:MAG: gliding motility protein GldN [Prevotellaceae bacterium]|jgi:gliding motility associated protien GldN|nr:gliding motility protein GldN [Prevotellaceae bacterium]
MNTKKQILLLVCLLGTASLWAQRQYPHSSTLPQDVVWMREIYRTLDLTKESNGALYYPVEPQGGRQNLFTTLFRLLAQQKIPVYEYQLDGAEHFEKQYEVTFRDVLDRFQIYYEQKKVANRRDSVISIHNSDIPSADVLSYFVKEVWYFDQRTSHYGSVITALCPVLHRSEEFSSEKVKLPMFWVNYQDLAPYLTQTKISVSNYNHAANSTWDDFFAARLYKGDIYKVTNLQNRTLAQYCPTDSALVAEQKRIEQELADFEKSLYGADWENETVDSLQMAKKAKGGKSKASATKTSVRREKSKSTTSKREAASVRATVRRERR